MSDDTAPPERSDPVRAGDGTDSPPGGDRGRLRDHPQFLRLWASQASGAVGDQMMPVALSLHILHRGGGAGDVGLVLAGRAVSLVVCLLVGGVIADRVRRTRVLIGADCFRSGLLLTTALLLPGLPLGLLPLVTALVGAGEALSRPASRSLVPSLLPGRMLERGNALVSAAQRGSAVIGTMAGVAVVSAIGARSALLAAGAVFALGALAVLRVPDGGPAVASGTSVLAEAATGLRAVRRRPWVMAVMAAVCLQLFAGTATALTLLPVVARREFGGDLAYGAVLATLAFGALPAIVLAGRWRPKAPGLVSMLALSGYALLPLSLARPFPLPVVIVCFLLGGFVVELYFIYWVSALQRSFPDEVLGKVFALDQLSAYALLPVGYALVGPAVGLAGQTATLVVGGVLVAASAPLCLAVPGVARFGNAGASAAG
ncbi:MFS transporter [Streptomyces luteireticuli]|uniref:MFS transporter n=1 Tax=Streptomyces luteireticuli TaxID=173858 RepID=A0ABP3ILE4_9ACTN